MKGKKRKKKIINIINIFKTEMLGNNGENNDRRVESMHVPPKKIIIISKLKQIIYQKIMNIIVNQKYY